MSWACELTEDAEQDLRKLPKAVQKRVVRVVTQMESDPFQGDVKALHGVEWKGVFRRRIGDYRSCLSRIMRSGLFPCSVFYFGPARPTARAGSRTPMQPHQT